MPDEQRNKKFELIQAESHDSLSPFKPDPEMKREFPVGRLPKDHFNNNKTGKHNKFLIWLYQFWQHYVDPPNIIQAANHDFIPLIWQEHYELCSTDIRTKVPQTKKSFFQLLTFDTEQHMIFKFQPFYQLP